MQWICASLTRSRTGIKAMAARSPARRRQLFDDLEELARRRLLVRIERVDELEGFLLELGLGHVSGIVRYVGAVLRLDHLDAIRLRQWEFRWFERAQRFSHRHHHAVDVRHAIHRRTT